MARRRGGPDDPLRARGDPRAGGRRIGRGLRRLGRPAEALGRARLLIDRLARLLGLDHPAPGERTRWTVRGTDGIYLVELEQFVSGTRVRVDGHIVARASAWRFPAAPFRFAVGSERATLGLLPDTATGTLRATLIVAGARVPPDAPDLRGTPPRPSAWRTWVGSAGAALATVLISAAILGDPWGGWVAGALKTALDVAWLAALRGVDPFGLLPGWLAAITASRPAMLLLGLELGTAVWLARDVRHRARLPRLEGRLARAAAWTILALAASLLPLAVAG